MNSIVLPGTLEALEPLSTFLTQVSENAGLDAKAAYRLQLAIDEIVTNSIVHGYQEAGLEGEVSLHAEIDDRALTVVVEDTGTAFDPNTLKQPSNLDAPLEERNIGGLGVYLALKSVDGFRYERKGNRNSNTFVIHRKKENLVRQ